MTLWRRTAGVAEEEQGELDVLVDRRWKEAEGLEDEADVAAQARGLLVGERPIAFGDDGAPWRGAERADDIEGVVLPIRSARRAGELALAKRGDPAGLRSRPAYKTSSSGPSSG
jgi:hypothetical protein